MASGLIILEDMPQLSNAEIAKVLLGLAQLLSVQKENPFKVKAYRRAAKTIANLADSVEELVRRGEDLTPIPGIGKSIADSIREIVQRGGVLKQLEDLRLNVGQRTAALSEYPLLDPKRVDRIYRKLGISTVAEMKERLERGDIGEQMGARMEQHVRQALTPTTELLLYEAHRVVPGIEGFLVKKCGVKRVQAVGDYRRRVETIRELWFTIQAKNFEGRSRGI